MDVGKPKRIVKVEPLRDPVPRERPSAPPEREPRKVPAEPRRA